LSGVLLVSSLGMAVFFITQKYLPSYKQGQLTRIKFTRNILIDLLGLLLTIGAASYLGGRALRQAQDRRVCGQAPTVYGQVLRWG